MLIQCDCSVDDYEPATVCTVRDVRARKQHWCGECGRVIEKGETYEYVRGLWEGDWSTHKTCLGCKRVRQHLCSSGWRYGGLAEQVAECVGFDYTADPEDDEGDDDDGPDGETRVPAGL
jgi:hypothetical protein